MEAGGGCRENMRLATVMTVLSLLVLSGISPFDRLTWVLEVSWVAAALVLWFARFRRVRITPLLFYLLAVHCVILIVGGYYTYERVPLGELARELFGLARNNYDRLGHFAQGFIPAMLFREMLLRNKVLSGAFAWQALVVFMMCMGFSAIFELIEWLSAVVLGDASQAFLGSQGDVWDAQWDMFCCGLGALASLLALSRTQDRQMRDECDRKI